MLGILFHWASKTTAYYYVEGMPSKDGDGATGAGPAGERTTVGVRFFDCMLAESRNPPKSPF
jgi:hypothetical protein